MAPSLLDEGAILFKIIQKSLKSEWIATQHEGHQTEQAAYDEPKAQILYKVVFFHVKSFCSGNTQPCPCAGHGFNCW